MALSCRSRLGIAFAFTLTSASCARPNLDTRLRQLAGPGAIDCGFVAPGDNAAAANACSVTAFQGGAPFFVRYKVLGIDSRIERGYVRAADGRLLLLLYDSDVTGGGSLLAKPKLIELPCAGQVIQRTPGIDRFVCG